MREYSMKSIFFLALVVLPIEASAILAKFVVSPASVTLDSLA
jgi:hypothetical protein